MLPRRQSIFHLGDEGGASAVHHRVSVVAASSSMAMGVRRARERERERLVVGLQILVHHHHHHGRHGHAHAHAANVVLKQMVRPRAVAASAGSRHGHGGHAFSCSFLKACFLCKRELSPDKDVYMYRGDQGFCSEECRWQQDPGGRGARAGGGGGDEQAGAAAARAGAGPPPQPPPHAHPGQAAAEEDTCRSLARGPSIQSSRRLINRDSAEKDETSLMVDDKNSTTTTS